MRCLYCGKELALLKRWTGGGEFCSDAHRQRYQEEYNQLALNRLLQAKPPEKPAEAPAASEAKSAKPGKAAEATKQVTAVSAPKANTPPFEPASLRVSENNRPKPTYYEPPSPAAVREVAPPVVSRPSEPKTAKPVPKPVSRESAPPPMGRFFVEMPAPAMAQVAEFSRPEPELLNATAVAMPNWVIEPLVEPVTVSQDPNEPEMAGIVLFGPHNRAANSSPKTGRERKLEVRDFARTSPVIEINLLPAGVAGLETPTEAMEILILPQSPKEEPPLWREPPTGFPEGGTELGALARLTFPTTGFASEEPTREAAVAVEEPVVAADPAVVEAPIVEAPIVVTASEIIPEPVVEVTAAEPEPEVEAVVEAVAEQKPIPEPVTKPLTMLSRAAAPGKGKPLQVFSAAANIVEVQVPRSTALPLRPLMIFGPAPIKTDAKTEPKKPTPAPLRPDPRLANAKPRGAAADAAEDNKLKPALKADAKRDRKLEAKEPVKLKEEPKPNQVLPAPLAAPYPGSSDLGLPRLNLQSSPGFLGSVPMLAKIGIVVALLAGLGGLIAFSSKSGGAATTPGAGAIVAGSALPTSEAGWITNWGADPGVRRTRQISILRSSQTLTDYRIEMNGQIESKAIGWVFRAADPKNFYVTKLEIVKPGLEPTVALVRFAIINGEEQSRGQIPLNIKARLDTMYKIRFDAVGDHFTTYVQDEKVDEWTDDRVKTGGVGFYRESGEDSTLKGGMSVVPLIVRR